MAFVRVLNRLPLRRQRSLGFAGIKPGNFYNMGPIIEETWVNYTPVGNIAVAGYITPPWIVNIAANTRIPPNLGVVICGTTTLNGNFQTFRVPANSNGAKPSRWFFNARFDANVLNNRVTLTDDGGLFGAELRITGGVITLNVFDVGAVVVFTTTFPTYVFAGGSYINIELAYDGIGNVAVYANYTNAASLPSIQFLANVVVGVGLSGGLFLALTGVKDSVHPTPVIVGPVARYGSAN